jgi:hypothetical protein
MSLTCVRSCPSTHISIFSAAVSLNTINLALMMRGFIPVSLLQLGVECRPQAVAEEVEKQHRQEDGDAGEDGHVVGHPDVIPAFGQHGAPFGRGRLGPQPQEAQAGGRDDGGADAHGEVNDDTAQGPGHDVHEHDSFPGSADAARRPDV